MIQTGIDINYGDYTKNRKRKRKRTTLLNKQNPNFKESREQSASRSIKQLLRNPEGVEREGEREREERYLARRKPLESFSSKAFFGSLTDFKEQKRSNDPL